MSAPNLSRLWVAAASRVIADAENAVSPGQSAMIHARMRASAADVEALIDVVADGTRAERNKAVVILIERFGPVAHDTDQIAAAVIREAVASACARVGVRAPDADRLADACSTAAREASAAVNLIAELMNPDGGDEFLPGPTPAQ